MLGLGDNAYENADKAIEVIKKVTKIAMTAASLSPDNKANFCDNNVFGYLCRRDEPAQIIQSNWYEKLIITLLDWLDRRLLLTI